MRCGPTTDPDRDLPDEEDDDSDIYDPAFDPGEPMWEEDYL